jgi:excisionase family DNA binding protein
LPPEPSPIDPEALAAVVASRLAERLAELSAKRYFSVLEAATYTGLSSDSVRSLLASGKLTGLRPVPGRVLIDRKEIDALMRSASRPPSRGRGIRPQEG